MNNFLRRLTFVLVLALGASAFAGETPGGLFGKDIQLDGGVFDYVKEKNAVVLSKFAVVVIGDSRIRARNMVYFYDTREIYAEGNVIFEEPGGSAFDCDRLYFNTTDWQGIAENVKLKAQRKDQPGAVSFVSEAAVGPGGRRTHSAQATGEVRRMVVYADQLRAISQTHQEGIGVKVTPSLFAKPHWHFASRAVNIRQNEKVESWHNVLKIGKIPVFYFPYIIKDLKYDWPWLRVAGGSTSDHGLYTFTRYGLDLDQDPKDLFRLDKIFFDADWRQERGWAFGTEMEYGTGATGLGKLKFYWMDESATSKQDDMSRSTGSNEDQIYRNAANRVNGKAWDPTYYRDTDRYALDWKHTQRFNERWDMRFELHKYSDRDFRLEYFETQAKLDKEPETSFNLRRYDPHWQLEVQANRRLNNWQDQTEYLPEVRLNVPGFRLFGTPVYARVDNRIGMINRRFDKDKDKYGLLENANTRVKDGAKYGSVFRWHHETLLDLPIHLGPVVLKPYVGPRLTYYSKTYGSTVPTAGLTAGQAAMRNAGMFDESHVIDGEEADFNAALRWGATASTRLYALYRDNKWRHTVEPTISFVANESPDVDNRRLYYFDEVDTYDTQHYFEFALNQKLQTRETGTERDVADFDVKFRYYPRDDQAGKYIYDTNSTGRYSKRNFTEIEFDLVLNPTEHLRLWTNGLIDPHDAELNEYRLGMDWQYKDRLRLYAHHQYYRGHYWRAPDQNELSRTTLAIRTPLWDEHSKYAAEWAVSYDWKDNVETFDGLVEQRVTLFRDIDTFELGFSFIMDKKDDDQGFFIELRPKGWMGINRPSSVSDGVSLQMPSRYGVQAGSDRAPSRAQFEVQAGETVQPEALVPEENDTDDVIKADPRLIPEEHDVEFEGDLPALKGAGSAPSTTR